MTTVDTVQYTRERLLTADPLSETHLARDEATGQSVLLRTPRLTKDGLGMERLRREAAMLATLRHPHIARLVRYTDTPPLLITEPLNRTLAPIDGPWPLKQVTRLMQPLAAALDYLHSHQVVHVTLEPASVGLTPQGAPRLLNLGLAYLLTHPQDFSWLQANPAFIAPELVAGERPTPQSDVYSLAALSYALLAGSGPFDAVEVRDVVRAVAFQPPPPLRSRRPDLPAAVYSVVERGMDRDPQQRYASAGAFSLALAEAASFRRHLRPLARSAAIAAMLLLTAVAGERAIRMTPPLARPVTSGAGLSGGMPVPALPQPTAAPTALVRSLPPAPLLPPLAPPVVEAAPSDSGGTLMTGRGALTSVTATSIDVAVGGPLTITVREPEPTAQPTRAAPPVQVRQAAPAPRVVIPQAPVRPVTNAPVRPVPTVKPAATFPPPPPPPKPTAAPEGWSKPVTDTSTWKRR